MIDIYDGNGYYGNIRTYRALSIKYFAIGSVAGCHMDLNIRTATFPPIDAVNVLGQLSMSLAHEVNNPLTVALSNTQLLLMDMDSTSPLFELVQEIHAAHLQIAALIRNFADIGSQIPQHSAPTNLAETIDDALTLTAYLFRRAGINVTCNYQSTPIIIANRNMLKLALTRLFLHWSSPDTLEKFHPQAVTVKLTQDEAQHVTINLTLSIADARLRRSYAGPPPELRGVEAVIRQHQGRFSVQNQRAAICCAITLPENFHLITHLTP